LIINQSVHILIFRVIGNFGYSVTDVERIAYQRHNIVCRDATEQVLDKSFLKNMSKKHPYVTA